MVIWPLGARPDLSPEDKEVKQKLVKCAPRAYYELIKLDIPGSSGARPARLPFLRSSLLSVMKCSVPKSSSPSVSEPLTTKPTWRELRSRLEMLVKKIRSMKRKPPSSPAGCPPARGKTLKVGPIPLLRLSSELETKTLKVGPIPLLRPSSELETLRGGGGE